MLLGLAALLLTPYSHAASQKWPAPDEESLVLLELRLDNHQVTDLLMSYRHNGGVAVPLQEISQLLGINIHTYPADLAADGQILGPEHPFYLDLKKGEVTLDGRVKPVPRDGILVGSDDIYVDSRLLSQWLPLDLNIDLFASRATVLPRVKLPFQSRLERRQRISQAHPALGGYSDPGYPRRETPYRLWNVPAIDQTLTLEHRRAPDIPPETDLHYTSYATMDLLYMESAWYLAGSNNDSLEEFRLTLGRKDPAARLLGPLHATAFALGDISLPSVLLLDKTQAPGAGAMVSNHALTQQNQFDHHSFRGDLPPGWDVELYQNNTLLAYQQSRADGQYNFNDVPLYYGMNYFQLVFYGPYGQRRTEEYRFMLGESLTPPGQFNYRLYQNRDKQNQRHSLADFDVGVSRQLSLNFGFDSLPVDGLQHDYSRLGLRTFFSGLSLFTNSVHDQGANGGSAHHLGIQTRLAGVGLAWNHTYLTAQFVSADFLPSSDPIRYRDELRLNSAIPPGWLPRIPITFQIDRDTFYSGQRHTTLYNRLSTFLGGFSMTNQLRREFSDSGADLTDGSFQLSHRLWRYNLRGELLYGIKPKRELTNLTLSAGGPLIRDLRFNADYIRGFSSGIDTYSFGVNRNVGRFAVGATLAYTTADAITFNLTLSAGLGREPRQPLWMSDARPIARSGISSLNVFLDKNLNGIRDAGDEPLSGVGFSVNGSTPPLRTGSNGIAFLTGLPTYQPVDLGIATDTLEDPLWVPQLRGVHYVPRPGHTTEIDFPVTITSEIDGTVYFNRRGHKQQLADVEVELIDGNGKRVLSASSAFDGFYVLSGVAPGDYTVRVNSEQLQRYKLQGPPPRQVTIDKEGNFISGVDIVLNSAASTTLAAGAANTTPADSGATAAGQANYYIVQEGDWLWKIARNLYGDPHQASRLLALNRDLISDPNHLQPGVRLRLPPDIQRYTVKKDDWLWKIARHRLGLGQRALIIQNLNQNTLQNPDLIEPGQQLLLPTLNHD